MKTHTIIDSPIGDLILSKTDGFVSALFMNVKSETVQAGYFGERAISGFEEITKQLNEYFARQRTEFTVPIAPLGNNFQQRVWNLLRTIPYGETRSYGELATALGDPALARAVGSANSRNPISILVPCHRVIGADGSLTGYAGGIERKRFLLDLENPARAASRLPL